MSKRKNEMEKFVKGIMEMYNCNILYVIDGSHWYGNYGCCCWIDDNENLKYHYETLRSVYKIAHRIFMDTSKHQDDRMFAESSHLDRSLVLFNNAHRNRYNDDLYVLNNGQLYDAFNKYWYDIHDSKTLKKWLKKGYIYGGPEDFYKDQCEDSDDEYYDSSDEGCPE